MSTSRKIAAGVLAAALLGGGAASAQTQGRPNDCPKGAAEKLEGQVVRVSPERGTITVRDSGGVNHEFQASRETLQEMKVGDRIEAKLRIPENCRKG